MYLGPAAVRHLTWKDVFVLLCRSYRPRPAPRLLSTYTTNSTSNSFVVYRCSLMATDTTTSTCPCAPCSLHSDHCRTTMIPELPSAGGKLTQAMPLVCLELCTAGQNKAPLHTNRNAIQTCMHWRSSSGAGGRVQVGHLRGEEAADRVDIKPLWESALGRAVRGGLPDVERRPTRAGAAQLHASARLLRLQRHNK